MVLAIYADDILLIGSDEVDNSPKKLISIRTCDARLVDTYIDIKLALS